jgi:hypothetical protein
MSLRGNRAPDDVFEGGMVWAPLQSTNLEMMVDFSLNNTL